MHKAPALRTAPVTVLNVLRPSPPRPSRAVPHLVSLPTMDLVEVVEVTDARPKSVPPPLPPKRDAHRRSERVPVLRRPVCDDVLETLFEALRDLDAEADALTAARACLGALAGVVPSRASMVHAFEVMRRDFLVVDARGESTESMVLQRSSKDDPLFRVAIPKGEPFPWNDLRRAPVARLARFAGLPHVARVLVCPVLDGARWLGAIEIVDPLHDGPFRTQDVIAGRYVAQRYAHYLTAHGMVLDVAAIARHACRS